VLCAGCPHRGVFSALKKLGVLVTGDIGCYTLGCLPPFDAMHTTFCMGASIGNATGFNRAGEEKVVAVIGDSTFLHAGLPSIL
ncbi:MAG: indolepyruvate ferredoxin oxidoreductase subunit alpha, partial [Gammaproteobacteria bacterium]|nr:indolepyruvate ferredoxin oxidoreductase subunit alpha [Gammaproteobacteria bacterium]NIU61981.1 indolepyruvate ferredoxin oxidoreductase subunit alpha [Stutzerimonas stutzeri]